MKLLVTYEVCGEGLDLDHLRKGPLATGLDATNAQLEAEASKVRLRLVDVKEK